MRTDADLYQLVLEGFQGGLSIVEGSIAMSDEGDWRATVDRVTRAHPDVIASSACWPDVTDPGAPLLRWHVVKRTVRPDQGTRVLLVEGQAWIIDGFGKLISKHGLDDELPRGLTTPKLPEKKKP